MSVDKAYLAKLLVHGISQTQAAAALGCTQGYVAQLVDADHELASMLSAEEAEIASVRIKKDERLSSIEKGLIQKVVHLVDDTDSLGEAVTALDKITSLRERQQVRHNGQASGQVLELNLGKLADSRLEIAMGQNRVIMNIGGKDMTRAPSSVVRGMAEEAAKNEENTWRNDTGEEDDKVIALPQAGR